MDFGLSEKEFLDLTIDEFKRFIESRARSRKKEAQERASYDYILANLIGKSVARIYSSNNRMPDITEVYPNLFDTEDIEKQRQAERDRLSVARFKAFANNFNMNFKKEA